jgi:hypothetical protein
MKIGENTFTKSTNLSNVITGHIFYQIRTRGKESTSQGTETNNPNSKFPAMEGREKLVIAYNLHRDMDDKKNIYKAVHFHI